MLPYGVEIEERILQLLAHCRNSAQSCDFELLALVQALAIFEEADIVPGDGLDQVFGSTDLAQGHLETSKLSTIEILKCHSLRSL